MKKTVAVLDANVLYPAPVRDLLLSLASAKLFQPKWTKTIHDEWVRNLLSNRPDITEKAISRTVNEMNIAFPDAEVNRYAGIIDSLNLPDPEDRHVIAAAIKSDASHIVTANVKDFPGKYCASFGLKISHSDDFISMLILGSPLVAFNAFESMVERLRKPPLNRRQVLRMLDKCGLKNTALLLD